MTRIPRNLIVTPGQYYHIIARGNNKMHIFHDKEDYEYYTHLLFSAVKIFDIKMYHYVLMPNHVHTLMIPSEKGLSSLMHMIQSSYAKYFCKKYEYVGRVWQGRYKNILIDSDAYLFACGNYIELNPVRAGLADTPENWIYSSYNVYSRGEASEFIQHDPFYLNLGNSNNERKHLFKKLFV